MCGIAGVIYADRHRPPEAGVLRAMGQAIAHRGPDAEGFLNEPGIGLVHRRLSIIDLTSGDQPIGNEDGSIQVVFNGEIYNYRELRTLLESRGHRLATASDTECLVHLYEDEGDRLVERLRGMFVFALWDRNRRKLLLARDRLGIKPLYLYRDAEKLIFASELKAILAHPNVPRHIAPAALENYLTFGMVTGAQAIFQGMERLPPAHSMTISADDLHAKPRRYWQLQFTPDESRTEEYWRDAVLAKFDEAVRLHLIADVPVGAFLSGGVDSSAVVAAATKSTDRQLQTFSIGFKEAAFSELPYARSVAEHFGTHHFEEVVTPDAVDLLDQLTHFFDEPFADSSAIPTFIVSRLAAQHVKVVLSGDGGDEAFGGYARFAHDVKEAAVRRCLPAWFRHRVLGPLGRAWPKADWLPKVLRAKTALTNLSMDSAAAYANTLSLCRPPLRRQLLSGDVAASLNGHDPGLDVRSAFSQSPPGDALSGMLASDIAVFLPDDYLVKVDRASMAWGLEVRPPLLDHELLELAATIPSRFKIHRGASKYIFKAAVRSRLPAGLLDRPKQGFDVPVDAWLRGPLRPLIEDTIFASNAPVADFIDRKTVRRLADSHQSGTGRHGHVLWSLVVLARWCNRYLNSACAPEDRYQTASGQGQSTVIR